MFGWIRHRRRQRLMALPFPTSWNAILKQCASFFWHLDEADQARIRARIQVFVREKNWEGCGGQIMEDTQRVTIAAQMARMTLGLPDEWFDAVRSILLYPDTYVAKSRDMLGSTLVEGNSARLGEAWYRGPVILAWADVLATAQHPQFPRNVIIHEFAHQLDMRNGSHADGVPAIESAAVAEQWLAVLNREFQRLTTLCQSGTPSLLDCYGATNRAEFFAVASEAYFQQPGALQHQWPELFTQLHGFYQRVP
ncbi:MAG: zinc-dependent peptidase [Pirellulaceae bacterium]